jgi:hypothetical protein
MLSSRRSATPLITAALIAQAALLAWMVSTRRINADEGIYLSAAARIAQGEIPYRDFMYPQMPYLAYLYAPLFLLDVPPLLPARASSALASLLLSWLVSRITLRQGLTRASRVILVTFFALHALKLSTHSTAITHAVSDCGALLSLFALETGRPLLAGLSLGVAVGVRLPLTPLVALWAAALWWRGNVLHIPRLLAGFAAALVPVIPLAVLDPDNFVFGTVTLHTMRGHFESAATVWMQKLVMLLKWVVFPQDLLLLAIAASAATAAPRLPLLAAGLLTLIFLRATPTYLIYVVQVLPFLFLAAAPGFERFVRRPRLVAAVALLYLVSLLPTLGYSPVRVFSDDPVKEDRLWSPATVEAVVTLIRTHSGADARILSWWEGYPPLAGRRGIDGVGFWEAMVARKANPVDAAHVHCLPRDDLARLIERGEPDLIVAPDGTWSDLLPRIHARYERVGDVDLIHVYKRRN